MFLFKYCSLNFQRYFYQALCAANFLSSHYLPELCVSLHSRSDVPFLPLLFSLFPSLLRALALLFSPSLSQDDAVKNLKSLRMLAMFILRSHYAFVKLSIIFVCICVICNSYLCISVTIWRPEEIKQACFLGLRERLKWNDQAVLFCFFFFFPNSFSLCKQMRPQPKLVCLRV